VSKLHALLAITWVLLSSKSSSPHVLFILRQTTNQLM